MPHSATFQTIYVQQTRVRQIELLDFKPAHSQTNKWLLMVRAINAFLSGLESTDPLFLVPVIHVRNSRSYKTLDLCDPLAAGKRPKIVYYYYQYIIIMYIFTDIHPLTCHHSSSHGSESSKLISLYTSVCVVYNNTQASSLQALRRLRTHVLNWKRRQIACLLKQPDG